MNRKTGVGSSASSPSSLSRDFRLLAKAIADAFRALSAGSQLGCRCAKIHYAGWR